ncbi:hypothetical protein NC651_030047 [Populus alba x Populus x berolinensis]|nr:hypothetical protein NC651_030047 [Populus alba x Populus x berolinensis]
MLFQVGGQGTRPTFFEMAAAQQLPPVSVLPLPTPLDYGSDFDDDDHPIKAFRCSCGSAYCRVSVSSETNCQLQFFAGFPRRDVSLARSKCSDGLLVSHQGRRFLLSLRLSSAGSATTSGDVLALESLEQNL